MSEGRSIQRAAAVGVAGGLAVGAILAAVGAAWAFLWLAWLLSQWVLPVASVQGSVGPALEGLAGVVGACAVAASVGALSGRPWASPLCLTASLGLVVVATVTVVRGQYIFAGILALTAAGLWAVRRSRAHMASSAVPRRTWIEPVLIGLAVAEIATVLLSPLGALLIQLGVATGMPGPRPNYLMLALAMLWLAAMAVLQLRIARAMARSSGIVVPAILLSEAIAAGALLPWLDISIRLLLVTAAILIALAVLAASRRGATEAGRQ